MHVGALVALGHAAFAEAAAHVKVVSPVCSKPVLHEKVATLPCAFELEKDTLPPCAAEGALEHTVAAHAHACI